MKSSIVELVHVKPTIKKALLCFSQEEVSSKRQLGDTKHFCPVVLKERGTLRPCLDEFTAKYKEKVYYLSSTEAQDKFIQNPEIYTSNTEQLKVWLELRICDHVMSFWMYHLYNTSTLHVCCQPPALRVFMLGVRGSGKTTHGKWLAKQLGVFHIQFRERLQEMILRKTQKPVSYADDPELPGEPLENLKVLLEAQAQSTVPLPDPEDKPGNEEIVSVDADVKVRGAVRARIGFLFYCINLLANDFI